ncbi:MAG: hypothetical protein Q4A88_04570 [Clostridia bacterium]|nr:hypothetical protein [Clostridia bacterium]
MYKHVFQPIRLLIIGFVLVLLLSSFHAALHVDHDCDGIHCPYCACIAARRLLQQGPGVGLRIVLLAILLFCAAVLNHIKRFVFSDTLVSLSVRLSE